MFKLFPIPTSAAKNRDSVVLFILENKFWQSDFKKIVDFGCGKMRLFRGLRYLDFVEHIINVDIDKATLLQNLPRVKPLLADNLKEREHPLFVEVFEGNMLHAVQQVENADAIIALDVIQELKLAELEKATENMFGYIQPKLVVLSMPTHDYFTLEVSPKQALQNWASKVCAKYPNYSFTVFQNGFTTVFAVFARNDVIGRTLSAPIQNNLKSDESLEKQYKLLYSVQYPFIVDIRTSVEKMQHKINEHLENVFKLNEYLIEELFIYRIPLTPLIEYGRSIELNDAEVFKQLIALGFRLHDEYFTVHENYMINKYSSFIEFEENALDYAPFRGSYELEDNIKEANVSNVCLNDDEEEENWD